MHAKTALIISILANRFSKGSPQSLLSFLPEGEADQVQNGNIGVSDLGPLFATPLERLSSIHHSWLSPLVQMLPKEAQATFISALPERMANRVSKTLAVPLPDHQLAPAIQNYLLKELLKNLSGIEEVLPLKFLPETALTGLSQLNPETLVELVGYLGIHDLAQEMRHIVDNRKLKEINQCLTAQEQQYLKYCLHLKEKFIAPALGLDKWGGDCQRLKNTLQARGLIRLGKALSGEHPDLIWHLTHILDSKRGQALAKSYSAKAIPNITQALSQQVVYLMGVLKKKKP